jgi:rubrerythrin
MSAPELHAIEFRGTTRAQFILRGALATGAVYGMGAIAPYVSSALAATAGEDVDVLGFALSLEQLESAFYKAALANAGLTGDAQKLAKAFGAQEDDHVKALTELLSQLGTKPSAAPTFNFGLTDQASFLKLAVTLEDTGVGAYNGAVPTIATPEIASTLGSIVQTEGRHSAALRMVAGQDPAPDAFDKPISARQAAAAAQPYVQQGATTGG